MSEIVESHAAGERFNELQARIEALPPDMEEMYANIFRRMKDQERNTARLMCHLVYTARSDATSRQIIEAEAIVNKRFHDLGLDHSDDTLEIFQRRLRAKSGGLLEEVNGLAKTIHRSVSSFLKREGWLATVSTSTRGFPPQEATWLYVCCEYIELLFGRLKIKLEYTDHKLIIPESLRSSLLNYSLGDHQKNLFVYARDLEYSHQKSSLAYLRRVSGATWSRLWFISDPKSTYFPDLGHIDLMAELYRSQPWQFVFEQGLFLAAEEILATGKYTVQPGSLIISHVLRHFIIRKLKGNINEFEPVFRVISMLIRHGVLPTDADIIECLGTGSTPILISLLSTWPSGKLKLNRGQLQVPPGMEIQEFRNYTYEGEAVGPLWELARVSHFLYIHDYESMLDYFLRRGEDLDEICGPGGTMLHALIVKQIMYPMAIRRNELKM